MIIIIDEKNGKELLTQLREQGVSHRSIKSEDVLEQAQVYASAWSLVGSRFDSGSELENANEQKSLLMSMLSL